MKTIALYLKSIRYSGASIGNDIFAEIESAGQSIRTDIKIKRGGEAEINAEIAYFETEENILTVPIRIRITEKDILFDDTNETSGMIRIDLADPLPQNRVFEITVAESRGGIGRRAALFQIIIEANGRIGYVEDVDEKGWLEAIPHDATGEKRVALPVHLKVLLEKTEGGRDHFTVLEGVLQNTRASVSLGENEKSRFSKINPHEKPVALTYSISKKILRIGRKKYATADYPDALWTKDVYDIEIPDYPHKGGFNYQDKAVHATTWFRIGHADDRYIHTELHSRGCITVTESNRWDAFYATLISARKNDRISIGILTVID